MWGTTKDNSSSNSSSSDSSNQNGRRKPNGGASNAKGIYQLLGFVSFCLLLYKAWGPLLLVTCALAFILHLCYSLYFSDSLFTPYSLVLLGHVKRLALELLLTLQALFRESLDKSRLLLNCLRRQYVERFKRQLEAANEDECIGDPNRNLYRPSVLVNKNLTDNLTPRNSELYHNFALNGINSIGKTSTPISRGSNFKKTEKQNGVVNMYAPTNNTLAKKISPLRSENKPTLNLSHTEDILYNSKNSSWNHSMSPKVQDKSEGIRTVQTVAGPLLNTSRYNIDPKLYTDISSPGLSSRLTKYAAEANSRLTHQSQYGTGQFPKVNLNASPIPMLSPKVMKSRMPVTVRIAPPEITNYPPVDNSSQQEKSEKMYSPTKVIESMSCSSEFQRLKKLALKRRASREDIMLDIAKKQKADQVYEGQLDNLEETMQKRARDDSLASEDELSPQSGNQRPTKRSKSSSCHDVLNSLSSSLNVFTGVKRKALDSSLCNSPENEKHFKLSDASTSPTKSSSLTLLSSKDRQIRSKNQLNVRVSIANASGEPHLTQVQQKTPEISQPEKCTPEKQRSSPMDALNESTPKIIKEIVIPQKAAKLTDKLFMKPEPPMNEKLKTLIKEQGKVEARFKVDDKDEIKKQDIDNMRQNSMRMRLKSMFDAISGKSASKIDPDVVIQAEDVDSPSTPPPATTTAAAFATLNSLTTTTTVNTSPITTTIVPILKSDADNKQSIAQKHVTFNLPGSFSSSSTSSSGLSTVSNAEAPKPAESKSLGSSTAFSTTTTSAPPSFSFSTKPATSTTSVTSSPLNPTSSTGFSFSTNSNIPSSTKPSASVTETKSPPSSSSSNITSSLFSPKSTASIVASSNGNAITTTTTTATSSGFSFGSIVPKTTAAQQNFSYTPSATIPSFSRTSPTSSAPSFAFSTNTTSTSTASTFSFNPNNYQSSIKSTDTISSTTAAPVINFGNTLSKSPTISFTPASTSSSSNLNSAPSSIFGAPTTNSPFSMSNSSTAGNAASTTAATTTSAPSLFGFNAVTKPATGGGFSFNGPTAASTAAPASTAAIAAPTSTFSFGTGMQNNAMSAATNNTSSAPPPAYNPAASQWSVFNVPQAEAGTQKQFSSTPVLGSSPMFKGPSTTAGASTSTASPSIFGAPSSGGFGTTPASTATTTTPSLFGNNVAPTSTLPSLFGNTASTTMSSTAPTMSPFGASASQPQPQQQQQGSIFGGVNATTASSSSSSSIFGTAAPTRSLFSGAGSTATNPASAASSTENASIFGQSKPPPYSATASSFGANQSSGFSSPAMNNTSAGTSAFQLGSAPGSSNTPTFGKPTPTFGAPSSTSGGSIFGSTTGGFGSPSTTTQSTFGSNAPSNTFGATSPSNAFGSTAPSNTFGSNASAAPSNAFGSSTSTLGNTFGAGAPSSSSSFSFGSSTGTTSPFGGAPTSTQTPSLFGNTPATNSTSGATFSFGGPSSTQQQQSQPQQSSAAFSSNNNANAAGSGGGMFQFGGAPAARPAGFNFNAPGGAPNINFSGSTGPPPAFNAPAPNMFSIGTGSSTPRSRSSRQRRQR